MLLEYTAASLTTSLHSDLVNCRQHATKNQYLFQAMSIFLNTIISSMANWHGDIIHAVTDDNCLLTNVSLQNVILMDSSLAYRDRYAPSSNHTQASICMDAFRHPHHLPILLLLMLLDCLEMLDKACPHAGKVKPQKRRDAIVDDIRAVAYSV